MDPSYVECGVLEEIDEGTAVAIGADHSVFSCHQASFANRKSPDRVFRSWG